MFATLGAFPWSEEVATLCFGLLTLYLAKLDWAGSTSYSVFARMWRDSTALRVSGALFPGAIWWLSLAAVLPSAYGGHSQQFAIEIVC